MNLKGLVSHFSNDGASFAVNIVWVDKDTGAALYNEFIDMDGTTIDNYQARKVAAIASILAGFTATTHGVTENDIGFQWEHNS